MRKKCLGAVLLLAAAGCRMCSNCCDYSSPLADGPYATVHGRAGSVASGVPVVSEPIPAVDAEPLVQPPPPAESDQPEQLLEPSTPMIIQPPALLGPEY